MINELKNLTPCISFGFGLTSASAVIGQPVTVWLQTLYNPEAYTFSLSAQGTVTKISDYEYEVAFGALGLYEIALIVSSKNSKTSLQSNVITVNVL